MRSGTIRERGQVTALLVVLMTAFTAAFGLVYDGGEIAAATERAHAIAEQAARAGARNVDLGELHRSGAIVPDPVAAEADARAYLLRLGVTGQVHLQGVDTLVVIVTVRQPMQILGAGGLWSVALSGHGQAHLRHGVGAPTG
jgi:hypothetical protein